MGASGWDHIVAHQPDIAAALTALQVQVLADEDFYWQDDDESVPSAPPDPAMLARLRELGFSDDQFEPGDGLGPKPTTLAELDAVKENEEFWDVGTHSILDVDRRRLIGPDEGDHDGSVRPAPDAEVTAFFGSPHPTRAVFEQRFAGGVSDAPFARRWSGLYLVLHVDGAPSEIAFWGYSGD